jgi:hypothetical protein
MPSRAAAVTATLAVALGLAAGCDDEEQAAGPGEHADEPARTPPGWRTVKDRRSGFTISLPKRWITRTSRSPVLVRSSDRLLVATVAADLSAAGRESAPDEYARAVVDRLPGFEGSVDPQARRVAGSPYPSARVDAAGRLETSPGVQRITVGAFHRRGRATYSVVIFRNGRVAPRRHDRAIRRMLASLRLRS